MKKYLNIECYIRHDEDEDSLWVGSLSPEDLGSLYKKPSVKELEDAMMAIMCYMAELGCRSTNVNVNQFVSNYKEAHKNE